MIIYQQLWVLLCQLKILSLLFFVQKIINFRYLPIVVHKVGSLLCLFSPLPSLDLIHCQALPCIVLLLNTAIFGASWDFFPTRGCRRVWPKTNFLSWKKHWYNLNCFICKNKHSNLFLFLVKSFVFSFRWLNLPKMRMRGPLLSAIT